MAKLSVRHMGGKKLDAAVRQHVIHADQKEKSGGGDTAPDPFEAFVASLAMCMGVFAAAYLERQGFSAEGMTIDVEYELGGNPKRLTRFVGRFRLPEGVDLGARANALVRAALACPVHHSIRQDVEFTLALAP